MLWGLEGHPFVALIGFILNIAATALGGVTGLGWRLTARRLRAARASPASFSRPATAPSRGAAPDEAKSCVIGVVKETDARETRVAATPETVKKFIGAGRRSRWSPRARASPPA